MERALTGVERYRKHGYVRALPPAKAVWRRGTTRLLDYGPAGGRPVVVVPSLINRAYVLDLAPGRSLLRFLAASGVRPFLVDWDAPGASERGLDLDAYVRVRLAGAVDQALSLSGRPPALLGYCMGGLLALASALDRPEAVDALALLATPWDFHADGPGPVLAAALDPLWPAIEAAGTMPVDLIQVLFQALDPLLAAKKFRAFAQLAPDSPEAGLFVALEDWVNDGVPLAAAVAKACIAEWYGANAPAKGQWRLGGRAVDPAALRCPALVVVPERDRIVPPASAKALAAAIPGADLLATGLGHVGMVIGGRAEAEVWRPLARWLLDATARAAA